jgi:zinc transporter ZupT
MVGQMQAFAGGVMLFLSLFDLMPEATHVLGLPLAAIGFTSGALVFWAIVRLVPDPSQPFSNALAAYISQGAKPAASAASASPCPSLSQPRLLALARPSLVRRTSNEHADEDSAAIGSDPEAAQEAEPGLQAPAQGVVGVGAGGATGEDDDRGEKEAKEEKERRMVFFRTAFITALGISIHNFPEGVALYLSTMKGLRFVSHYARPPVCTLTLDARSITQRTASGRAWR